MANKKNHELQLNFCYQNKPFKIDSNSTNIVYLYTYYFIELVYTL